MFTQIRVAYRCTLALVVLACAADASAATREDDKQQATLDAGRILLLQEHKPAQAIAEHFDQVIRYYEAQYRKSKKRIYCARRPEEALLYTMMAAAEHDRSGTGQDTIVIDSTWSDAYFLKAYALVELKQPGEARKLLERALELSPMNSAYLSESAHLDQMDKDWDTALEKFKRATEAAESTTPEESKVFEWTRALRGQGFALIELGRLEEAKAMYYKALELDPDDDGSKGELRYIERMEENLAAESEPFVANPEWVVAARVAFVEDDRKTARPRMSQGDFRLVFRWIGGDLYGAPTTTDFVQPEVDHDYSFSIDLNESRPYLIRSLEVARFAGLKFTIEPADVRIARVATFTLNPDHSERVGYTSWIDGGPSGDSYILAYFDRACRIAGTVRFQGADGERKYDLDVPSAGYYWLRTKNVDESNQEMVVASRPADLVLAVAPLDD